MPSKADIRGAFPGRPLRANTGSVADLAMARSPRTSLGVGWLSPWITSASICPQNRPNNGKVAFAASDRRTIQIHLTARMKNASDAAAITAVAVQPQIAIGIDSVSRPMTRELRTISIITAMSGAASTPLTTAAQ